MFSSFCTRLGILALTLSFLAQHDVQSSHAQVPAAFDDVVTVPVGGIFTFTAETVYSSPSFSWLLEREGQSIATQAEPFFRTVFPSAGDYTLILTLRTPSGEREDYRFPLRADAHSAEVLPAGGGEIRAILRTHPPADAEGRVRLPAGGGVLRLSAGDSTGEIVQYALDLNADGNADNAYHASFRTGEPWQVSLKPAQGEMQRSLQLRVTANDGTMDAVRLTVLFDSTLTLTPRLSIFPATDPAAGMVVLPREGGILRFNAEHSFGGVQRSTLDLDLARDSDGDGNTENDDDSTGTLFTREGSDLHVFLRPRDGVLERRIALTVFDGVGNNASLERLIVFGEPGGAPPPPDGAGAITADPPLLHVQEPFTLRIGNIPTGADRYRWDLQGDGIVDAETLEPSLLLQPDAPGLLPVRVSIMDAAGRVVGVVTGEFTVQTAGTGTTETPSEGEGEILRIDAEVRGRTVRFKPVAASTLALPSLHPTWSFGDGSQSFLLETEHAYGEAGIYTVTLSFTDPVSGEERARAEAQISVQGAAVSPPRRGGERGGLLQAAASILSGAMRLMFFVALLLLLPAFAFLFFSLRAKREHLSFGEYLQRLRERMMGRTTLDVPLGKQEKRPPGKEPKSAPPSVALKVPPPPLQRPQPREPAPSPPMQTPSEEEEALPPWLQAIAPTPSALSPREPRKPSPSPPPLPPLQPLPPSPAPLPPPAPMPATGISESSPVPPWLQKGLSPVPPPSPPPKTPSPRAAPVTPPPSSPLQPFPPLPPSRPSPPPPVPPPSVPFPPKKQQQPQAPPKPPVQSQSRKTPEWQPIAQVPPQASKGNAVLHPAPAKKDTPLADDETIAIVEAEMPETQEKQSQKGQKGQKRQKGEEGTESSVL